MTDNSAVVVALDALTAEMHLLKHPFYQEWNAGTLSLERLRNYAIQYYSHVAAFPRYLSAIHSRCDDLETRQELLENLIEEERGNENHPELWLRFAAALGVARENVTAAEPIDAARALTDTYIHLTRDQPLPAALASLYVYESQIPAVAATKIDGLRRFYGITDPEGLRFFSVHREADLDHAQAVAKMLTRHCSNKEDSRIALAGATDALAAVWSLLDAV
jgi:pyrroloquinoline-quinone synthase